MSNKYNTTKREFFDFLIQEKKKKKEMLNDLSEKLRDYLLEGSNLQASKTWQYVCDKKGMLEDNIKYINKLFLSKI